MPLEDSYEILDISGRLILKTDETKTVNVEALKAGVYIIRNSEGQANTFIKQ